VAKAPQSTGESGFRTRPRPPAPHPPSHPHRQLASGHAPPGAPPIWAARPAPPPRLEGCRHGGRARRRRRRGNPRTRPPSDLPLGPGRHACLSHCPPARYAAPDPPPQSTLQPGTAGPVASRLSIYSPTPLGWENGGQPLECTKNFPGDPLNYVSGPCTMFFPIQSGPPFWSRSGHRTDLVKIRPISRGLPGQNRACPKSCLPAGAASPARPPLHTPSQLAGSGCLVEPAPPTGQFGSVQRSGCVQNSPHRLVGLGGVQK
jgi:hypothetical protein